MKFNFIKAQGLGNDFVMVPTNEEFLDDEHLTMLSQKLASRRFGIGCDQVIFARSLPDQQILVRFFNPDGSEAEACGNGTRCIAKYFMQEKGKTSINFSTVTGEVGGELLDNGEVSIHMTKPEIDMDFETQSIGNLSTPPAVAVNIGNPHLVCFVNDVDAIEKYGAGLERHPYFKKRTNVGFAKIVAKNHIKLRVWERGAGLTPACGSGACAAVVAAQRRNLCGETVRVTQEGGDLTIICKADKTLIMTGPAELVYRGTYPQTS